MVEVNWGPDGLAPCAVQNALTGRLLMIGHMNQSSLELSMTTGFVHFWSRSRNKMWKKGETSGHTLSVVSLRTDCDRDALVCLALPEGPTCHTGVQSCFFEPLHGALKSPILHALTEEIEDRKRSDSNASYTKSLLSKGVHKISEKVIEESQEFVEALKDESDDRVASECADILFHCMVGLAHRSLSIEDVAMQLLKRFGISGHDEKRSRE